MQGWRLLSLSGVVVTRAALSVHYSRSVLFSHGIRTRPQEHDVKCSIELNEGDARDVSDVNNSAECTLRKYFFRTFAKYVRVPSLRSPLCTRS
ncbi:hypothetical protein O3P69_000291 [Scylla paramamosain]|uniref:Secreted protein n=1 Tax=Scylla paramamosain TaxID=85552 RepID=A0AAW0UZN9_SCYPA